VLLPLWNVEGPWWMREDVRDAKVCVALVGDVLRDSEEQDREGCDEGRAAKDATKVGPRFPRPGRAERAAVDSPDAGTSESR
jgi:hypothetical protein